MKKGICVVKVTGKDNQGQLFNFKCKVPSWVGSRIVLQVTEEAVKAHEESKWELFENQEKGKL